MKVAVFGGSGATGRVVTDCLLEAGFAVQALCRRASSLGPLPGLTVIEGALDNRGAVRRTLAGSDAALILFGPRPPYCDIFCARATANIVAAMQEVGIRRLICQTGAMIGNYPANRSRLMRRMCAMFNQRYPELAADRSRQEQVVIESGLDWTILKPPRLGNGTARPLVAGEQTRVGMLSSVSRRSLAEWLAGEIRVPRHAGQVLFVRRRRI